MRSHHTALALRRADTKGGGEVGTYGGDGVDDVLERAGELVLGLVPLEVGQVGLQTHYTQKDIYILVFSLFVKRPTIKNIKQRLIYF